MRIRTIHIWFRLLSILGLVALTEALQAQDSLVISNFKTNFQKNLNELNISYSPFISGLNGIHIETLSVIDFLEALKEINLPFFETPVKDAEDYFLFLNNLSEEQKELFIKAFYINEKYISEGLETANLPHELIYLAPAFSAMNRNAIGEDSRAGIWQITHFQGILNGLSINRLVDERFNERLALPCYIQEIKQNIELFGSTELAILAQWYGRTKVQNAIYFTGKNFSLNDLLGYFPETALDKIAAFQAVAVFLNHNFITEQSAVQLQKTIPDTIQVAHQLHFKQISKVLNIPEEQLVALNPQYRFEIVPRRDNRYRLVLPPGFRDDYIIWQDSIFNALDSSLFEITAQKIEYPPAPGRQYLGEPVKDLEIEGKTKIKYLLKSGDVLGIIAEKYDVRVEDLKYWNNISNERRIQAGKTLDIFVDDDQVEYYRNIDVTEKEESSASNNVATQLQKATTWPVFEDLKNTPKIEYEVKSGESPYTIAKKFDGVTPEEILLWNNIDDARKIQIGQKLTIYLKE